MPTGQPDPRSRARPFTPAPAGEDAFDLHVDGQAGLEAEALDWDADLAEDYDDSDPFVDPEEHDLESDLGAREPTLDEDDWQPDSGGALQGRAPDSGGFAHPEELEDDPEGFEDQDLDLDDAEGASWLMELDESELESIGQGVTFGDPEEFELPLPFVPRTLASPRAAAPSSRSPWLLAAVVVLSVGAGVTLSRGLTRFTNPQMPFELWPSEQVARGPAAPTQPGRGARPAPVVPPAGSSGTEPEDLLAGAGGLARDPILIAADSEAFPDADPLAVERTPHATFEPDSAGSGATPPIRPTRLEPDPGATRATAAGRNPEPASPARPDPTRRVALAEPEPLSPLRGPVREATAADLAGVWTHSAVPFESIDRTEDLVTPLVGRVRVITFGGEMFEGRLHAVGRGKVWLQAGGNRMALMGWQIARIEHVLGGDDTPTLGETGSQSLTGLPSVRVRTPGGVFYGRLISQQGERVTLLTAEGARISLDRGVVEPAGRSRTRVVDDIEEGGSASRRDG